MLIKIQYAFVLFQLLDIPHQWLICMHSPFMNIFSICLNLIHYVFEHYEYHYEYYYKNKYIYTGHEIKLLNIKSLNM